MTTEPESEAIAQPFHILCADDDLFVLAALNDALQAAGHRVELVTNGLDAINRIRAVPTDLDLIITDTRALGLDGFGLVAKAREVGFSGKIIVFANPLSREERERFRELGVDRIVDKPDAAQELLSTVARFARARTA
jgi:two-component system, OmpR family, alkaline phosphatase synthesis response regulator PhoP